jgi:hypothetical protein
MVDSLARLGRHRLTIERTGAWLGGWRRLRIRYGERFYALAMTGLLGHLLKNPPAATTVSVPDGRPSHQARAPDARSPASIPIATGRPRLRGMGSGTAAPAGSNHGTPFVIASRVTDSW